MATQASFVIFDQGYSTSTGACSASGTNSTLSYDSDLTPIVTTGTILYSDWLNVVVFDGGDQWFSDNQNIFSYQIGTEGEVLDVIECPGPTPVPPTPTPTATEVVTPTPTATEVVTPTPTATEVVTPTPTATEVVTPTPTATEVVTPTPTATEVVTPTPTATYSSNSNSNSNV